MTLLATSYKNSFLFSGVFLNVSGNNSESHTVGQHTLHATSIFILWFPKRLARGPLILELPEISHRCKNLVTSICSSIVLMYLVINTQKRFCTWSAEWQARDSFGVIIGLPLLMLLGYGARIQTSIINLSYSAIKKRKLLIFTMAQKKGGITVLY